MLNKERIKNIVLSFFSIIALFFSINKFLKLKNNYFYNAFSTNNLVLGILLVVFFYIYEKSKDCKIDKSTKIMALIFAIFMLLGEVLSEAKTYFIIFNFLIAFILSIIKVIGYYSIFKVILYYIEYGLKKIKIKELKPHKEWGKKIIRKFNEHPFLFSLLTILIFWSIYIIAFYPIVLSPDPSFQIKQYFNVPNKYADWVIMRDPNVYMTTHHPITQTFMLGWAIELGRFVINDNFGLFIYTIVQTLIYASVLAYTIKFAKKHDVKNILRFIVLGMYVLVPMFGFYTVSAVKDTLYTAFMILFTLFIYDIIDRYKEKKISWGYALYFAIVMILVSLFRHNGVYVILLSLPALLIYSKVNRLKIISSSLIFFVAIYAFNNILVPSLGISDGSVRELLSVPFQQTARYVKEHESDLTREDKEAIDKVLGYDDLAKRYDPELADSVKNEFNKYATKEDLKNYFKVWFKGLLKHPGTYIDATLNNVYGYFYPGAHKWYFYHTFEDEVLEDNLVDYHFLEETSVIRTVLTKYGYIFVSLPLIGLLSSIGFNLWILIFMAVMLIKNKKYRYLIPLVPLYGSFLICLVSPANTYFRYTMPYVFAIPIIFMLLFNCIRGVKDEKK